MYIVIDGIDGCGKSTVLNAWIEYLADSGKKIFNLKKYWEENKGHPEKDELIDYDVIISAEPTNAWTGAAIREEMIKNGNNYTATSIADAYALDRLVLLKRLIVPLRESGKLILQDRSASTSICYQPIQDTTLSMDDIAGIEGNKFALQNAPDHLVIADLPAEEATRRLSVRTDKNDNAIFEHRDFLKKARDKFLDPEYQKYFLKNNTQVHILDCSEKIDIMKQSGINLLKKLLS